VQAFERAGTVGAMKKAQLMQVYIIPLFFLLKKTYLVNTLASFEIIFRRP
jgi:hypothetical protein